MRDELKLFGLVPLFAIAAALSTAALWRIFAMTLMNVVPGELTVLACVVFGLIGPLLVWATVLLATGSRRGRSVRTLRQPAAIGIGIVLAAEVGFYVPLGLFAIAFH
jgi:hypothetical protein